MEEIDGRRNTLQVFTRNARKPSALAADGHIECLVAFFTQLVESNVLADLNARPNLHADFFHDVDFCVDDVLLKFV